MPTLSPDKEKAQAQDPLRPGCLKKSLGTSPGGKPPVKAARVGEDRAMEVEGLGGTGGMGVPVSPRVSFPPGLPSDSSAGGSAANLESRFS